MSGVSFCLHDLRRTFITIAQDEVPYLVLKKLVNHSVGSDVTAGYSNISLDKLRPHQQIITNKILKAAGLTRTAKIINLHGRNKIF